MNIHKYTYIGTFKFENLVIYGIIGQKYKLRVYQNNVRKREKTENMLKTENTLYKNENFLFGTYFYSIPLIIENCHYGEILQQINNSLYYRCTYCSPGSFSLDLYGKCNLCPDGAECSHGLLNLLSGYWRYNDNIFECKPFSASCM